MTKIKYLISPMLSLHLFCYYKSPSRDSILADVTRFMKAYGFREESNTSSVSRLLKVLLFCPEFRNIFYIRVNPVSSRFHITSLLQMILPKYNLLSISVPPEKLGKGFYIEHGNSTIVSARKIGENCWVNQNVTIGDNGKGIPEIGSNVRVGTGAVLLGPIKIGDNVIIGANSTVVKDIPDNCTVVPSPSFIMKLEGERVWKQI